MTDHDSTTPEDGDLTWHGLSGLFASDVERLDALVGAGYSPADVERWVAAGGDYAGSDGADDRLDAWLSEDSDH